MRGPWRARARRIRRDPLKILFLDFDGVLNGAEYREAASKARIDAAARRSSGLDVKAVARLNRVLAATGASVVVTSSWRVGLQPADLQAFPEGRGFQGKVVGVTPWIHGETRGEEIAAWLEENAGEGAQYAIVDDVDDMGALSVRLVRTDPKVGLTDKDCKKLISLLAKT